MSSSDEPRPAVSDLERDVLAHARAGLSPSAADGERVRRALALALSAAPAASTGAGPASPPTGGRVAGRAGAWAARLIAGATIAVVAGGTGYIAGRRDGRNAAALQAPPAPAVSAGASEQAPVPQPPAEPPPAAASQAPPVAAVPSRKRAAPAPAAKAAPPPSLEEEVRGVRAIERALREGSPSLALALSSELDRTIPEGRLVEERAATRAIAACALGRVPFGVDLATEFGDRYPESAYLKRVRQSCANAAAAK